MKWIFKTIGERISELLHGKYIRIIKTQNEALEREQNLKNAAERMLYNAFGHPDRTARRVVQRRLKDHYQKARSNG